MAYVVREVSETAGAVSPVPVPQPRSEDGLRRTTAHRAPRPGRAHLLVAADVTVGLVAGLVAGLPPLRAAVLVALVVLLLNGAGLYRPRLALSALDDVPAVLVASLLAAAMVGVGDHYLTDHSHTAALTAAPLVAVLVLLARTVAYAAVRRARRRRKAGRRAVVVGSGVVATELLTALTEHPEYGILPVGALDDVSSLPSPGRTVPTLGDYKDLGAVVLQHDVRAVFVAFGSGPESAMVDVLRTCDALDCEFFFVPRLYELHGVDRSMENVWGIPVKRLRRPAVRSLSWRVKRGLDVLLAGTALVLLSPVLLLCALLVRYELGAPVLFRQERLGVGGEPFVLYKFCSLRPDGTSEGCWSIAGDERVGPVGRFLRRTSLDELPQLWNVVRGDMSLVGPRPERALFVERFTAQFPGYRARHRVPAGLTGWSQVHGLRGDTSISHRTRFDNFYIENWSLWEDVKIMVRTVGHVARPQGR